METVGLKELVECESLLAFAMEYFVGNETNEVRESLVRPMFQDGDFVSNAQHELAEKLLDLLKRSNDMESKCVELGCLMDEQDYLEELLMERTNLWYAEKLLQKQNRSTKTIAEISEQIDKVFEESRPILDFGADGLYVHQLVRKIESANQDLPFWLKQEWYQPIVIPLRFRDELSFAELGELKLAADSTAPMTMVGSLGGKTLTLEVMINESVENSSVRLTGLDHPLNAKLTIGGNTFAFGKSGYATVQTSILSRLCEKQLTALLEIASPDQP